MRPVHIPIALTIAGSDSGGGAGIQADLKTFAALGVHGTSAVTCLTAQNPSAVLGVHAAPARFVQLQIEAICKELAPTAIKTGMLFSTPIIEAVVASLTKAKLRNLVVDPVMVSTSGAVLLKPSAIRAMKELLLPMATVITPNLDETSLLVGRKVTTLEELRDAARELHRTYGCAVLAKGGHLESGRHAVDIFCQAGQEIAFCAPFKRGVSTHGTGCTYSAAIAAGLASKLPLADAIETAKGFITDAIHSSQRIGKHSVLNTIDVPAPRRT